MSNVKIGDLLTPKTAILNGHRMYETPEAAFHLDTRARNAGLPDMGNQLLVVDVRVLEIEVPDKIVHVHVFRLQNMTKPQQEGWVEDYGYFEDLWEVVAQADGND